MAHELTLPDFGLGDEPVTVSLWLVDVDETVVEGDRVVEVLAGNATVDLPAPVGGVLARQLVEPDDRVYAGQVLGLIVGEEARQ